MNKKYTITLINKINGASVKSMTNNLHQRIDRLKLNVRSINGNGSAVFKRFEDFIGASDRDIKFVIEEN